MRVSTTFGRRDLLQCLAYFPFLALCGSTAKGDSGPLVDKELIQSIKAAGRSQGGPLRVFYPKGSLGNLAAFAQHFTADTGIELQLVEASLDEISAQLMLEHRLNRSESVDVALPPTFSIPDLVTAGVIANLDDFAKRFESADFFKSSLYTLGDRFEGRLYGYQADGDTYLMFYNKDWFELADHRKRYEDNFQSPLRIPLTWSELDQQMAFFNKPDQGRFGGSLFRNPNYVIWEFWVRMHAKGVLPFDSNMRPQVDSPEAISALEELVQATQYQEPEALKNGLFENFQSFGQGNKYANVGWGGTQKYLQSAASQMRGRLLYGSLPGGSIGGKTFNVPYFNWGWNYVVLERSKRKELAYLFCLYAASVRASTLAVRNQDGYFDPHRLEHFQDPAIIGIYGQDFLKAHRESLADSIPDLYLPGYSLYMAALKNAATLAIVQKVPAQILLKKTAQRWNEITEQQGRDAQTRRWLYIKGRYPKHLSAQLR